MSEFNTRCFGVLTYREESVIHFPEALPGFPEEKRFLLVEQPVNQPLVFLQSLRREDLCFAAVPVRGVLPGYTLAASPEELEMLELPVDRPPEIGADVLCLAILAIPEQGPPTANLLSPLVINPRNRRAAQVIQFDSGHSHRQALEPAPGEAACS